ncbi:SH3 domain-containing protein [Candidatus Solirubrobacter pratensis]|uniref:SH3 domain-containing protein n=1 Tax=Candidatus Solirubrobacter pratensis TaxID=1298857 RepID=UPI00040AC57B|nr:SH3 domain-containing protein [Candidatus Solirubrobacter pratensis]
MTRPEREQREAQPGPERAPKPPSAPAAPAVGRLLALQRAAGNSAVTAMLARIGGAPAVAPPPVASVHHTQAELEAMTLEEFERFAEGQADWAAEPGRPAATPTLGPAFKAKLRALLEFAREDDGGVRPVLAGCGTMTVRDLVATGLTFSVRAKLRSYAQAVAQSHVTIQVQPTADVARAQVLGEAVRKLEAMPGPGVSHTIFKQTDADSLGDLVDSGHLDDFIAYCRRCHPLLEAPGAEIDSYLALRNEGADPIAYSSRLADVRNFHRFEKAALDALVLNRRHTAKDRPLFLILHSNFDHNGAFHRDPNLTAVITEARHLTLLIEGKETLDEISSELSPLAHRYGQGNQVSQVMFAGHGNSNVIQMAGTMDTTALDAGEAPERAELGHDITSAPGQTADTDRLLHELLAHMATDGSARIVLNGCLTASNSVNAPLDPDPRRAAAQVQAAISAEPSLATYLGQAAAASNVSVRGANASFGQVGLMDPSGNLDIVAAGGADPMLTAPKIDYIRGGTEPQGALRAVLEVWAADRAASPPGTSALDAMRNRLATEAPTPDWDARIIRTLYTIVGANSDNGELIRRLGNCAGDLSELKHAEQCRVGALASVPAAQVATIFNGVTPTDLWATQPRIPLVILQRWLHDDATKKAAFLAQLGGAAFTCNTAKGFVDIPLLGAKLGELIPVADAPRATPGQLKLSLLGAARGAPDATCRDFLRAVVGGNPGFPPALGIDGLLGGMSTQADVEIAIGVRGPAATPPVGGPAAPPNNVDLDGDGVNDFRVEPITRRGAVTASSLHVRRRPDVGADSLDLLPRGARVSLIGTSGDWYAIEHRPGTAFVHHDWVELRDQL